MGMTDYPVRCIIKQQNVLYEEEKLEKPNKNIENRLVYKETRLLWLWATWMVG
jgi:hypothetical protein